MGKHKNATKGQSDDPKGCLPAPSSCVGEAGYTGDVVYDLRDEVASLEEVQFVWCGRSPSEWSSLPMHWQSNPAQEDQTCYCIQVRVTLGDGGGDQPQDPPMHELVH